MAKRIIKGAAMTVLTTMPTEPVQADCERLLFNKTKSDLARLILARKTAAIVLTMRKNRRRSNSSPPVPSITSLPGW